MLISLTLNTVGTSSNVVDQEVEKDVVKEGVRGHLHEGHLSLNF
jgi:hypothetical protein